MRLDAQPAGDGWVLRGIKPWCSLVGRLDRARVTAHVARLAGPVGWYLDRSGFAWGGIGVAACWLGGAIGVAPTLLAAGHDREPDQLALAHLGAVAVALFAADAVVTAAAAAFDGGDADGPDGARRPPGCRRSSPARWTPCSPEPDTPRSGPTRVRSGAREAGRRPAAVRAPAPRRTGRRPTRRADP